MVVIKRFAFVLEEFLNDVAVKLNASAFAILDPKMQELIIRGPE